MAEKGEFGECELCRRAPIRTTRHHLVPLSEGGRNGPLADLCAGCHRMLHVLYTNEELREMNSVARLRQQPEVRRYLKWVKRQPPETGVRVRRRRS
jgi:5-methylcytosine-specific restriction enzyme A